MILMQMGILREAEVKDTQMLLIFMGRLVTKFCHFFCQPKEGTIVREILQNYHDYMDNLMTPGQVASDLGMLTMLQLGWDFGITSS